MPTITKIDGATFEHKGIKCSIVLRLDLRCLYQVHGHRESDNKHFLPKLLFDQNLTFEQIRDVSIAIMDGTFSGENIETYGNYSIYVGV